MKNHFVLFLVLGLIFWNCSSSKEEKSLQSIQNLMDEKEMHKEFNSHKRDQWQKPYEVLNLFDLVEDQHIMDLGAGSGYFSYKLAQMGAHVLASDIDSNSLHFINKTATSLGYGKQITTRLVEKNNPFLTVNELDAILMVDVYHYLQDRKKYLQFLFEGLKKGGSILILESRSDACGVEIAQLSNEEIITEMKSAGFMHMFTNTKLLSCQSILKFKKMGRSNYYHTEESVNEYLEIADGTDGAEIIDKLKDYLPKGKTILELGMGPGTDLDLLKKRYSVVGSDISQIFLDKYLIKNPDADILLLDASTIDTERKFDAIYSNKVLHHLTEEELIASIKRQAEVLNAKGIICHTFWKGENEEIINGLLFNNLLEEQIKKLFTTQFEILLIESFQEFENDDSILIIARKR